MTQLNLKTLAIAAAVPALAIAAPAQAAAPAHYAPTTEVSHVKPHELDNTFEHKRKRHKHKHRYDRYDRYDDRGYGRQRSDYRGYDQPVYRDTRIWRGRDGRYYCRKENGTTGLLIGAAVGGLIGNEVAGRGDKTLGAILGAAGGAILGRSIDRSNSRCR